MWKRRVKEETVEEKPVVTPIRKEPEPRGEELTMDDLTPAERKAAEAYFTRPVDAPKEPVDQGAPKGFGDIRISKHI